MDDCSPKDLSGMPASAVTCGQFIDAFPSAGKRPQNDDSCPHDGIGRRLFAGPNGQRFNLWNLVGLSLSILEVKVPQSGDRQHGEVCGGFSKTGVPCGGPNNKG